MPFGKSRSGADQNSNSNTFNQKSEVRFKLIFFKNAEVDSFAVNNLYSVFTDMK
jgi:hypothetical protein